MVSLNTFNIQKAKHQRQSKAPSRVPGHRSLVTAHWCWTQGSCAPLMAGVARAGPSWASPAHSANRTDTCACHAPGTQRGRGDAQRPVCDLIKRGQARGWGQGIREPRGDAESWGTARLVETRAGSRVTGRFCLMGRQARGAWPEPAGAWDPSWLEKGTSGEQRPGGLDRGPQQPGRF